MKEQQEHSCVFRVCLLCVAVMIVLMSNTVVYGASISLPATRISAASDKFDGVVQFTAAFKISERRWLRAHHIEFAVGSISSSSSNEVFVSIGPVWRAPFGNDRFFADISIAPTLTSNSRFGERDVGGHFHFTSSASVGMKIGRSNSLALRIQHMSNAGLRTRNPGMDMVGLEFSLSFSD